MAQITPALHATLLGTIPKVQSCECIDGRRKCRIQLTYRGSKMSTFELLGYVFVLVTVAGVALHLTGLVTFDVNCKIEKK